MASVSRFVRGGMRVRLDYLNPSCTQFPSSDRIGPYRYGAEQKHPVQCASLIGTLHCALLDPALQDQLQMPLLALFNVLERIMANIILAEMAASISELKKNPMGTVAAGEGFPVAILNRNEPAFYCIPAKAYEALMDRLEDLELNAIADARANQAGIKIKLNEL